ncbi:Chitin binding protein [Methanosarcina siciliae HI350]|uniref:Chitin binding protein n=1 Tax=Methanosarcina siciliae HI350 TaxID=1434119 RepID=A0A0E3LBR0_9EURY|nr:leucine-rich repeat protein [Methanosarcina siciliae]AKB34206.1 Chitin binding protein [Methanosarcina siciliae HI350]
MQKKRFFVLTTVMLLLSIAMLAMPAVATGEATITRTITPSEVSDGDIYNVTLTVSFNTDNDSIVIHEALPADWNLTEVDSGRYIWNTSEEDYTFLDFYGTVNLTGVTDTITYSVTVPDGTVSGTYDYGPSYVAGESASEEEFAWTVNTTGDDTVTINGTILNIYSTAMENTNPGAPDPGIPGFVGPNGDGITNNGTVNPIFIAWASTVVDYSPADQAINSQFSDPGKTLGPVTGDNFDIVSLGDLDQDQINAGELPGSVTLGFDFPIADGAGPDLAVFENGFGTETIFAELAYVEVSTDGIVFVRFPSISLTSGPVGGYGTIDPTGVYNLAGKHANAYGDSWGTPFDLSTLSQAPEVLNGSVDLNSINYVRIVDIPGSGDFKDSRGNPIYDGWVTWGSGGLDLEAVGVINVGAVSAPVADFTADVTSGAAPLTVRFNDASTGVIIDYAWDFDNDGIVDSTSPNPSFTYEAAGTYTVSLTVSNTGGSSTETRADYIVAALPDSPVADFSVDVTSGAAPLTVQFTDLTTNKPVSWAWDFESDGIIDSYEQNPFWTYNAAGNYTVTLTATNLVASDTVTRVNLTSVVNLPPMADFSADPLAILIGCSVQFTDLSANSPTSWQWDFNNDGTIDSTMQNPSYTYTTAGTYTVNLTVSNPAGSGDEVKSDYITVKEQASPASDFTYTSDGSSITITEYIGSDGIVIIPAEIEGLPVTTIGAGAFADCSGLTTLSIPNSVTTIGTRAFEDCSALTSLSIPDSVTTIGDNAFSDCSGLTTLSIPDSVTSIGNYMFQGCSGLTTLSIPDSVTSIGNYMFQGCSGLTTLSIPDNVTTIGTRAFEDCSGLTTLSIPNNVTTIGASAFEDCFGLTTLSIGSGVTYIGSSAFSGCSALTAINVDTDNSLYASVDGVLYDKDITTLIQCPSGKTGSVTIPDSITSFGDRAFYGCTALTSVTIPDGVTSIGNYPFYGCSGLTLVTIGNSVTSIGTSAFYSCTNLTSLTIGNSVTSIGNFAFRDCSALTTVTIPDSVTSISILAFSQCSALTTVNIGSGVTKIGTRAFSGCSALTAINVDTNNSLYASVDGILYDKDITTLIQCPSGKTGSFTIPDSVTSIGTTALIGCALTAIDVDTDNSVYSSIDGILYDKDITTLIQCPSGKTGSVTIPDSVTTIGSSAFSGCFGLTTVTIPDSVTTIGEAAFRDCTALTSVVIPDSVTSIGNGAFRYCTALTSVTIPDSVTNIGSNMFHSCTALTSVTIPDSVTSIDGNAFYGCSALTSLVFMGNAPEVDSKWAYGLTDLVVYYYPSATGFTTPTWNGVACYPLTAAPVADFEADVTSGIGPMIVNFTDQSTGIVSSYAWDFNNDGTVDSTEQNPSHTYASAGTYTVNLTVSNANGTDSEVKTDYITVSEPSTPEKLVAAFTADVTGGTTPLTVNFTDQSTGSPTAWAWDFDNDGNVDSTEQNPSYTYNAAGNYTVNLTVENEAGSDFELKTDYIEVSEASGSTVTLYFDPESSSVSENESAEISIVASNFPAGFSGYNITVAVDDPAVAEIIDIEYPSWALITENSSLPGTSIYLKAVDGNNTVKADSADVVLATLTVSGKESGSSNLSIGVDRLDDDSGETIEPEFLTGKIKVTLLSPLPDQEYAPKDLNGDGLYEDLTGNGEFSFVDIVAYFHNMDWIEENMPVEYFDFNGNGRIDFDDVVDMFGMI